MAAKRGKSLQFPDPTEVTQTIPSVLRTNAEMVEIYNQEAKPKDEAKALSSTVRKWVEAEAKARGWGRVLFPLEYPSKTLRAGCVFVK